MYIVHQRSAFVCWCAAVMSDAHLQTSTQVL